MWNKVKAFAADLPEDKRTPFFEKWIKQQKAMGQGGADLLYVTGDTPPQYANCFQITQTFYGKTLTRQLLKNPDGIVCWKDQNNNLLLYSPNHETQTLERIEEKSDLSLEQKAALTRFKEDMVQMEPTTVRRSNNQEHQLFQDLLRHGHTHAPIKLTRCGIHFKQDGIDSIDTHHDFNRVTNARLKCIRLYQAADAEPNKERQEELYAEADKVWRAELGHILKQVIWLLQRYCEENRPFYPVPNVNDSPFVRSLMFYNWATFKDELLFSLKSGQFRKDFGVDSDSGFSLYKAPRGGAGWRAVAHGRVWSPFGPGRGGDLFAEYRLPVDASNTVEIAIKLPTPAAGLKPGR